MRCMRKRGIHALHGILPMVFRRDSQPLLPCLFGIQSKLNSLNRPTPACQGLPLKPAGMGRLPSGHFGEQFSAVRQGLKTHGFGAGFEPATAVLNAQCSAH